MGRPSKVQAGVCAPPPCLGCRRRVLKAAPQVHCGSRDPIDYTCVDGLQAPWCSPGTAPVRSPCGVFSGGVRATPRDMLDLPAAPAAEWVPGTAAEVGFSILANHGGGCACRGRFGPPERQG